MGNTGLAKHLRQAAKAEQAAQGENHVMAMHATLRHALDDLRGRVRADQGEPDETLQRKGAADPSSSGARRCRHPRRHWQQLLFRARAECQAAPQRWLAPAGRQLDCKRRLRHVRARSRRHPRRARHSRPPGSRLLRSRRPSSTHREEVRGAAPQEAAEEGARAHQDGLRLAARVVLNHDGTPSRASGAFQRTMSTRSIYADQHHVLTGTLERPPHRRHRRRGRPDHRPCPHRRAESAACSCRRQPRPGHPLDGQRRRDQHLEAALTAADRRRHRRQRRPERQHVSRAPMDHRAALVWQGSRA